MKKIIFIVIIVLALISALSACNAKTAGSKISEDNKDYYIISQEEAQRMMNIDDGHIIVDVRRQEEYDSGHIKGAILIPNETIENTPPKELPDFDQIILIYCRSGNRSKQAAQKLANMGYTNIYEFGGINTWNGKIVSDKVTTTATLVIRVGDKQFYATLEDNSSTEKLAEKLSEGEITIDMHDYGSFEKVGDLPWSLPENNEQITTEPGDIVLYQGNKITVYYDENTWELTRLAKINNVTKQQLLDAFGEEDASVTFWLEWSE